MSTISILNGQKVKISFWKAWHRVSPSCYEEARQRATGKDFSVSIYKTSETGEMLYAISDKGFWFAAFKRKKDAIALCKVMGWKVVGFKDNEGYCTQY